jgi:hypothetical protein
MVLQEVLATTNEEAVEQASRLLEALDPESANRMLGTFALYNAARAVAEGQLHLEGDTLCIELSEEDARVLERLKTEATAGERGLCFLVGRGSNFRLLLASALEGLLRLASLQAATGHRYLQLCDAPSKDNPEEPCGRVFIALPRGRPRRYCQGACRARASRERAKVEGD